MIIRFFTIIGMAFMCVGCSAKAQKSEAQPQSVDSIADLASKFDADSAYAFVREQVNFGPRVAGTKGNADCRRWIIDKLRSFGVDTIITQPANLKAFNGDSFEAVNIFASHNRLARERILLLAHYDTRPWADEDPDPSNHKTPILGANDGGSGVAVMLEIARRICLCPPNIGVDFLFTDAEDYGDSSGSNEDSWALGTQYFAKNLPYDRKPLFGILLDIVGGIDAKFYREYFSEQYAKSVNAKVWTAANACGLSSRFVNSQAGAVTDDHIYINRAGIPCIDIIECNNPNTGSFPPTWHTLADDLTSIDKSSLKAVGTVVLYVIYNEG